MKVEAWIFGAISIFFLPVTVIYWYMSRELAGTVALLLTFLLAVMITAYLALVARRIEPRPEDRKSGEIVEGAGEQGFFPPQSIWPLFCALAAALIALGPVFGWWLSLIGIGAGFFMITGWLYQYYRGEHAH